MGHLHTLRALTVCITLLPAVFATGFEGQLTASKGGLPADLSVQVRSNGSVVGTLRVAADGSFLAPQLSAGSYEFRVLDMHGDMLTTQFVTVSSGAGRIDLRVPGIERPRPVSGSVSIHELATRLPKNVKKLVARAEDDLSRGDIRGSIKHLEAALAQCPDCALVHNNLGSRYMRVGAFAEAVRSFERAVELDPASAKAHGNLAIALVTIKSFNAAEEAARKALRLDHIYVPARYVLGLVALGRRECTLESVAHLEAAADLYPRARLSAAAALECRGDDRAAAAHLSAYLKDPHAELREQVEQWRRRLFTGLY